MVAPANQRSKHYIKQLHIKLTKYAKVLHTSFLLLFLARSLTTPAKRALEKQSQPCGSHTHQRTAQPALHSEQVRCAPRGPQPAYFADGCKFHQFHDAITYLVIFLLLDVYVDFNVLLL